MYVVCVGVPQSYSMEILKSLTIVAMIVSGSIRPAWHSEYVCFQSTKPKTNDTNVDTSGHVEEFCGTDHYSP